MVLSSIVTGLAGFIFWVLVTKIAGVYVLGVASAVFSAASIAGTIASAGLAIAVLRETSAVGIEATGSSILFSIALGVAAALIAIPLSRLIGYGGVLAVVAALMALFTVIGQSVNGCLLGRGLFHELFASSVAASIAKIGVGVALVSVGLGVVGVLLGCLAYGLAAVTVGLTFLAVLGVLRKPRLDYLKSIAELTASNYPFVFSGQLLYMLNIYLYVLLGGGVVSTGALYISLMAILLLASIPGSLVSAGLSVSMRRRADTIRDGLRIGLAAVTPLVVVVSFLPSRLLELLSPKLASSGPVLAVLLASIPPLAIVSAEIMRLNAARRKGMLALIGVIRLAVMATLLPILVPRLGSLGAALAFTIAVLAPIPLAREVIDRKIATASLIQVAAIAVSLLGVRGVGAAIIAGLLSLALIHELRILTLSEAVSVVKAIIAGVIRGAYRG